MRSVVKPSSCPALSDLRVVERAATSFPRKRESIFFPKPGTHKGGRYQFNRKEN
jgi:hypothetical protein